MSNMAKQYVENVNLRPFMNPEYWDGHTLGVGEALPYADETFQNYRRSDSKFARASLEAVRTHAVVPIKSLYKGQTFNPFEYQPGTVVLYRGEALTGTPVEEDMSAEELAAGDLLDRPIDTSPSFGSLAPAIRITDMKRRYTSTPEWAVVPIENNAGYITACAAGSVGSRSGHAHAPLPFINEKAPFVVGEVRHWKLTDGREHITRVNILHVIAYGVAERQKGRVFSFAGRTAFNGA